MHAASSVSPARSSWFKRISLHFAPRRWEFPNAAAQASTRAFAAATQSTSPPSSFEDALFASHRKEECWPAPSNGQVSRSRKADKESQRISLFIDHGAPRPSGRLPRLAGRPPCPARLTDSRRSGAALCPASHLRARRVLRRIPSSRQAPHLPRPRDFLEPRGE